MLSLGGTGSVVTQTQAKLSGTAAWKTEINERKLPLVKEIRLQATTNLDTNRGSSLRYVSESDNSL